MQIAIERRERFDTACFQKKERTTANDLFTILLVNLHVHSNHFSEMKWNDIQRNKFHKKFFQRFSISSLMCFSLANLGNFFYKGLFLYSCVCFSTAPKSMFHLNM